MLLTMPPNDAKSLALRWLSQRSLSVGEVQKKLYDKGFSSDSLEAAVERLLSLGLLDDRKLAEKILFDGLGRHEGPYGIIVRMRRRLLTSDLIDEVMEAYQSEINWQEIAEPLGQRYDVTNPKQRARLARRMARQGFPTRVIQHIISVHGEGDADGIDDY